MKKGRGKPHFSSKKGRASVGEGKGISPGEREERHQLYCSGKKGVDPFSPKSEEKKGAFKKKRKKEAMDMR